MGYGQGSAGTPGTGFQLLIIIFMLLFGVSLGQLVAALSPSVQVATDFPSQLSCLAKPCSHFQGCCAFQSLHRFGSGHILWCNYSISGHDAFLEGLALSAGSIHKNSRCHGFYRATVRTASYGQFLC